MAAASKSPTQVNSPRNRQSRRSSASRGVASPPPLSLSETFDQEQFVNSSSTTSSDTFPSKEAIKTVVASSSLVEDGSAAGADAHLDNSENGGAAKKQAWNKPSNGAAAEVGAVMGAESWPALSETARTSPKASSTCSLKALSNGSIITSEVSFSRSFLIFRYSYLFCLNFSLYIGLGVCSMETLMYCVLYVIWL